MAGLDHPRSLNRDSWLLCHLAVARHHAIFEAGRPLHWSAEAGVTGYMIVEAAVGFQVARAIRLPPRDHPLRNEFAAAVGYHCALFG